MDPQPPQAGPEWPNTLGIVLTSAGFGALAVLDYLDGGLSVQGGFIAFASVAVIAGGVAHARQMRSELQLLRQLPREERDSELGRYLSASDRYELKRRLEADELPPREGGVESFVFPRSTRYAAMASLAVTFLAMSCAMAMVLTASLHPAIRGLALVVAVGAAAVAWALGRRWRHLQTVLEVTPFALREVHPGGLRRWVLWKNALVLTNNPRRRRVEIRPPGSSDAIMIDYGRLEFFRIVHLVWEQGGFKAAAEAEEKARPGDHVALT